MPVVVLMGARQTGKSTLVRALRPGRRYVTLDDLDAPALARDDPEALVDTPGAATFDEVQRAPQLLHAAKRAVDERRTPGRYILTGSANLLLSPHVSESLAGRASYLTLGPMTRREQRRGAVPSAWEAPLHADEADWLEVFASAPGATDEFVARFLTDTGIEADLDLGEAVWRRAALAQAAYATRRRTSAGGEPKRLLIDFLVGAHAQERTDRLLTLDPQRYRSALHRRRRQHDHGPAYRRPRHGGLRRPDRT